MMHDTAVRTKLAPTVTTFGALQTAYDHFNATLFGGRLPHCLLTLHRKKRAYGYFCAQRFDTRKGGATLDEIALNPSLIRNRDDAAALSTLVHEMCHLEQQHFGTPPKTAYHNREWADMMDAVGLTPSDTGAEGGKRTGPKVSHFIVPKGPFDRACKALLKTGYKLPYMDRVVTEAQATRAKAKAASKTKFTCPTCDANAWAKPTASLICGECDEPMETV